jgi:signal transduction histidine kinase
VEDFLRMARPLPAEMGRCSIQSELETVVLLVANDAKVRNVSLDLEPASVDVVVKGNGEKLRQAFLNIAINSLQATSGGGRLTISSSICRVDDAPGMCEIRFCDSGEGIDAESLTRIFEPFYTTKPDGTGLGLAISRKIIEGHGGTLQIESEVGVGTTVMIRLPVFQTGGYP